MINCDLCEKELKTGDSVTVIEDQYINDEGHTTPNDNDDCQTVYCQSCGEDVRETVQNLNK